MGQRNFKNILNSTISVKYFALAWPDSETRISVFLWNVNTEKSFEETKIWDRVCLWNIQNFKILMNILLWYDQTQKHEFGCFYTMSVHNNHFNKQKYGTVYLRNIENSNKIDKILYCVMTRFRNVKLDVFRQYQNTKAILQKKNTGQNCLKKLSKFQRF